MLSIGSCSWKYPSWEGLVYEEGGDAPYLAQYARKYASVEVDQWFWSLFYNGKKDKLTVVLPKEETVLEYASQVPDDFSFTIKVPNSLTLTEVYKKQSGSKTIVNPHFLSRDLFDQFLKTLEPLAPKIGCLMFQFEYLNRDKMKSLDVFIEKLSVFFSGLQCPFRIALEPRNPNYLKPQYFQCLNELDIYHVFLIGYYMPPLAEYFDSIEEYINDYTVIRLHGDNRHNIEKITSDKWDKIVMSRDPEIHSVVKIIQKLMAKKILVQLNVNNHYEGSAPRTIQKIQGKLIS